MEGPTSDINGRASNVWIYEACGVTGEVLEGPTTDMDRGALDVGNFEACSVGPLPLATALCPNCPVSYRVMCDTHEPYTISLCMEVNT